MTRRLNADAATTLLVRLDEPAGGTAIDLGPGNLRLFVKTRTGGLGIANYEKIN